MHPFCLPSGQYQRLLSVERVSKFSRVFAHSPHFGSRRASLFLRTTPIQDVPLFVADPAYKTNIASFYPIYLDRIVMLGYLIMPLHSDSEFIITDKKTIVRRKATSKETFERGFASKQMLMMKSKSANLFIPAVKYEN